jgi:hypothetical protein
MPAHRPTRPVAAHCDGRGVGVGVAVAAPAFYCWLRARATRARQANGGVLAGRGSPSRLGRRNAVEAGQVRFSGTAGHSSSRACVVGVTVCTAGVLDSKLRALGELNYGASARCGSLLRARVGRQHSRLQGKHEHFVAKNGGPADTMQPHALQCTTATVKEYLSNSRERRA